MRNQILGKIAEKCEESLLEHFDKSFSHSASIQSTKSLMTFFESIRLKFSRFPRDLRVKFREFDTRKR